MGSSDYEVDSDASCMERFLANKVVQIILYSIMICYGLFCVIFDWLWVADTLSVEKALVFGPPDTGITVTLIVVVSIGTVIFSLELTNATLKLFYDKELMDEDLAAVITLFIDEVPNITLNAMLAACREVPMSYYQMVKAALAMFSSIFRTFKVIKTYFEHRRNNRHRNCWIITLKILILAACVYNMIAACLVWVYTYSEPGGGISIPDGFSKSYDSARYLYKSGVYFTHPVMQRCGNSPLWEDQRPNWLKVEGVYTIQDSYRAQFNFSYNDAGTQWVAHTVTNMPDWLPSTEYCYRTDFTAPSTCTITRITNMNNCNLPQGPGTIHTLTFEFGDKDKTKTRVFGDITYKGIKTNTLPNGTCTYLDIWDGGEFTCLGVVEGQLQYFQLIDEDKNDTYPYFTYLNNTIRHYNYPGDLPNITDVWKTGYKDCDMSGSYAPNWEESLPVTCGSSLPTLELAFQLITLVLSIQKTLFQKD